MVLAQAGGIDRLKKHQYYRREVQPRAPKQITKYDETFNEILTGTFEIATLISVCKYR